jgi:hypothetical protein
MQENKKEIKEEKKQTDLLEIEMTNPHELVMFHFPKPTYIADVVERLTNLLQIRVIMSSKISGSLQIFAPTSVPKNEVLHLFLLALESEGHRVLIVDSQTLKILPKFQSYKAG